MSPHPPDPVDALEPSAGVAGLPVTRAQLDELQRPRPWRALAMTAALFGAWIGLGLAARAADALALRVLLWAIAGFLVNGLVQLGHDAWHGNLFPRRWQNTLYGHLFSLPFAVSFSAARHAHRRHHWYNRTERDPDAYNVGAGWRVRVQYYAVVFAGLVLSPLHFNVLYPLAFYRRRELAAHAVEVLAYAGVHAAVLGLWLVPAGLAGDAVVVWIMPIVFATPWNGLKSVADHHGNVWKGDRFHTATTVRTTALWTFLWNGLNYHLDHHLFPKVPGCRLAALHGVLRPELERRGAPLHDGYLRVFWAALRAGPVYVDDGHQFLRGRAP